MKKWFVCLLVLLALVLASSTAMALVYEIYCQVCQKSQDYEPTGRYIAAPNEAYHLQIYRCPECGTEQGTGYDLAHEESKAATCISQAYCDLCHKYYGDKDPDNHAYGIIYNKVDEVNHIKEEACSRCKKINYTLTEEHTPKEAATCMKKAVCAGCNAAYGSPNPDAHNWSDWQPNLFNSNLHYRYCMNIGCSASESESHDGNSNCVTSATCSKCNATYKDTTKHVGPFTYTYEKYDESFHKRIETCTACGNKTGNQVETRHEESTPAECTHAAWCNVCNQAYGDPNPDNHRWGNWTYENENLHYRICSHNESHIQHADHRGNATCIDSMPCLDCGCSYKDPDKHQGGTDFDYTNVSDTEHKVTVTCGGCHGEIKTYQEGHSEHTPATCSSRAICAKCSTPFGDLAPNNHIGEATTTYVKTSETQHTAKITYADCKHTVDGASTDHTETTAATCTAAAYCAVCKSSYGNPDSNAHDQVQHDAQAPTCTEIGWDAYETCSRCDYTTYVEKSALGHDRVSHDAKAPTCTTIGWDAYETCSRCDYTTYVEKSALGHDRVSHDAKAPTCTAIGWDAYETCSRCDYTTYVEKSALGHDRVSHDAKAPTCTEIGWDAYETCSRCDYSTYVEKTALGHDAVKHDAQAPTCTAIGWDAYETCSRCDYSTYAEKPALGHDIVKHDAQAPTCTEIGWDAYETCARCDYSTYAEKPALGHDIVKHDAQAPTCTAIGWDAYDTCSRCDYTTYAEKPALGHDIVNHDAQAPTCTAIGWDAYETCSRCDYSTYAEKPALGHDYAAKTTKPSCTEKGYTTHTCTRCQDSYRDAYVAALGHGYGEWSPNADGTNSATCLRDSYEHTVDCAQFAFALTAEDVRTEFTLCPVCGEISQIREIGENGETVEMREVVRLLLVEDATAKAVTERLPAGELVVRMGSLPDGELLMSVAFEISGKMTQPTGQVKITLPAELLDGYALHMLSEDGTETDLTLDVQEEASFVLNFTNSQFPVQLIRLVPEI